MSSNNSKDFDLYVGGLSGVFKGVKIDKSANILKNIHNSTSVNRIVDEVTAMSWADDDERQVVLGCGSKDKRSIKMFDCADNSFVSSFLCEIGTGKINGVSRYNDGIFGSVASGQVIIWRPNEAEQVLIEAGDNLERMRHSRVSKNLIATGGKENKLKLWDLETQKSIFEEKNIPNDWLQLRVPIWISDIGFLSNSSREIATCSRYGHIRFYDTSAQKRPVVKLEIKDQALTTLAVTQQEKQIIVGSGKGVMNLIDLRKPGKILNTYKDFAGGISAIACTNSSIVSVGLDRYLRIHDIKSKKLNKKIYLTSQLSCMVVRSDFTLDLEETTVEKSPVTPQETEVIEEIDNDEEYDEMFSKMPVVKGEIDEGNLPENQNKKRDLKEKNNKRKKIKK